MGGRPVLRLIPASPVDADDLAEMFHEATGGKFPLALTRKQRIALGVAIEVQASCIPTRDVLDVLRDYVKHSMPGFDPPRDTLTAEERVVRSRGITPECVVSPGWLSAAIQRATAWRSSCTERIEMAQQARRELGYEDE